MKKEKSRSVRRMIQLVMLIIVVGYLAKNITEITYAVVVQDDPDVVITITGDGEIIQQGNLFGDELWYPGKIEKGIIRINNHLKDIHIHNLRLRTELVEGQVGFDPTLVYASFLDHMKISMEEGKFSLFNNFIIRDKSLKDLMNTSDNQGSNLVDEGPLLDDSEDYRINKDKSIDFRYTLYMDDEAGEELENLEAEVDFLIDFTESIDDRN